MGGPTGAAEFPGDTLFDDVEEFKADGQELGTLAFMSGWNGIGKRFSFLPRDESPEAFVKRKGAGKHGRGVGETGIEFTESFFEIAFVLDGVGHSGGG